LNSNPNLILFASSNKGKIQEVVTELSGSGVLIIAPACLTGPSSLLYGFSEPLGAEPEVEETANSYLGNARLKAEAFFKWSGLPSLADDSGLEVDALNGEPGIFSSRYAGENCDAEENIKKLLRALEGCHQRSARFRSVLCLKLNNNKFVSAEGVLEGLIAEEPKGSGGFGYDSVFVVKERGKTLAELKSTETIVETHRHRALQSLLSKSFIKNN